MSLCHGDKDCGAITSSIHYYSIPEKIVLVEPEAFIPSPSVYSEVIKLNLLKEPKVNVLDKKLFFELIKIAFSQRRKTFVNSLSNSMIMKKEEVVKMFLDLNFDEKRRGETFTLEEFAKMQEYIINIRRSN